MEAPMKRRYTIVFSNYDDIGNPYYGGGGALAVHEVARRLVRNHDVTVITGMYPRAKRREVLDGVSYERIGRPWVNPKAAQLAYHFTLPQHVRKKTFDVWIESFTPPFSTSCLQLFTDRPVIGLVHMLSGQDMWRKYKVPFHLVERLGLKTYRYCIVLTPEYRERIRKIHRTVSLDVIPNGVNRPTREMLGQHAKTHLLFLGRIEVNQKGLDLLVKAYARIQEETDYPLVIAGGGAISEEESLRAMIQREGLGERVKLTGKVKEEEKRDLLQKAVALMVPSRFETFSLAALEALAYEVPVIAFSISGLEWMPKEGVIKVEPFDEAALAEAMLTVAGGGMVLDEKSRPKQSFWKQYDWGYVAKRYESYIAKVVDGN
jgi:phosphatidylinositol alpha-mannosyltransferase